MCVERRSTVTSRRSWPRTASSSDSREGVACTAGGVCAAGTGITAATGGAAVTAVSFCRRRLIPKSRTKQTISSMKTSVRVRSQISFPASVRDDFLRKRCDPAACFSGAGSGACSAAEGFRDGSHPHGCGERLELQRIARGCSWSKDPESPPGRYPSAARSGR